MGMGCEGDSKQCTDCFANFTFNATTKTCTPIAVPSDGSSSGSSNTWIWIGVGMVVVLVLGVTILMTMRKKAPMTNNTPDMEVSVDRKDTDENDMIELQQTDRSEVPTMSEGVHNQL